MEHTLTCPPLNPAGTDANPSFNVVIAYEDFDSGKHAKRTYDFLAEHLGRECRLANQMWKFDVLALPKLREIAVEDAARADIIIVSGSGRELPAAVKSWIDAWLAVSQAPLALVALFNHPREEANQANAVRTYLAEVARRGNMEFFAQPDVWPGSAPKTETTGAAGNPRLNARTISTLAGAFQRGLTVSRWNFNE